MSTLIFAVYFDCSKGFAKKEVQENGPLIGVLCVGHGRATYMCCLVVASWQNICLQVSRMSEGLQKRQMSNTRI